MHINLHNFVKRNYENSFLVNIRNSGGKKSCIKLFYGNATYKPAIIVDNVRISHVRHMLEVEKHTEKRD